MCDWVEDKEPLYLYPCLPACLPACLGGVIDWCWCSVYDQAVCFGKVSTDACVHAHVHMTLVYISHANMIHNFESLSLSLSLPCTPTLMYTHTLHAHTHIHTVYAHFSNLHKTSLHFSHGGNGDVHRGGYCIRDPTTPSSSSL